jgi:hypothetical protein
MRGVGFELGEERATESPGKRFRHGTDRPESEVDHNIYLGFLAELGIVGLVLVVAIAGGSLRTAALAAREVRS